MEIRPHPLLPAGAADTAHCWPRSPWPSCRSLPSAAGRPALAALALLVLGYTLAYDISTVRPLRQRHAARRRRLGGPGPSRRDADHPGRADLRPQVHRPRRRPRAHALRGSAGTGDGKILHAAFFPRAPRRAGARPQSHHQGMAEQRHRPRRHPLPEQPGVPARRAPGEKKPPNGCACGILSAAIRAVSAA